MVEMRMAMPMVQTIPMLRRNPCSGFITFFSPPFRFLFNTFSYLVVSFL